MRFLTAALGLFLLTRVAAALPAAAPSSKAAANLPAPSLVLTGKVRGSQNQTYFSIPFQVPAGVHRITVRFTHDKQAEHTALDLGIADPERFRGNSGGNKQQFTISEADATPSYLPGAIIPGKWKLLISVPNIRPDVTAHYRAEIWFHLRIDDTSFTEHPLSDRAGWYRGDLHMHTAHSDGSCPDQTGQPVPCPLFVTVQTAVKQGLDFIAITDHNAISQYDDERELQPYFDKLLMIPGREMTTFHGHANIWGTTRFVDYRVGTPGVPNINAMFRAAHELGALVSINHPEAPSGEICMGCGWTANPPANMRLVNAVEVMNGNGGRGFFSGLVFWQSQLARGYRLTAVGGSDNHHGGWPPSHEGSVGSPTTVVHASNLSVAAILAGIRAGHVFLDLSGSRDRLLTMQAHAQGHSASMGDDLELHTRTSVALTLQIADCAGDTVQFYVDGKAAAALPSMPVSSGNATLHTTWTTDGQRHWIRAEVRDASGKLVLFGNPAYLNFDLTNVH
ncbi:MAG: CehA/McbA family metallohydrolase [Acidobacteriaceae bacterium]